MSVKPEMLNRGLFTVLDQSMMPMGGLKQAQNARYRPGDPAIWQSEGRASAGTGWDLISSVAGLVWDTGTIVLPTKPGAPNIDPQLKQILYVRDQQLLTVPAMVLPNDPNLNFANSQPYAIPGDTNLGPDMIVPVQFKDSYYLLSGGKTIVMKRSPDTGQITRRSGLPIQTIKPTFTTTGVGDYNIAKGFHFFWFTWYDAANDIESDVDPDLGVGIYRASSSSSGRWNILANTNSFDAVVPIGVTGIRIYKTLPFYADVAFGSLTPPASPWPVGYRLPYLADTTKAYIPFVTNSNGLRFPVTGADYNLLSWGSTTVPSTAENENHLSDYPIFPFGTISLGGIPVNFGINGEPPKSNTGDVFEESLVTNDLVNKRNIRFSMPNNADQFPEEYFIPFDTNETDEVIAIRRLGNKLGVFLRQGVWRVEWLPNQSEFDFSRGRVMDEVKPGLGVAGAPHYCVAKFNLPGQGPMLAWISRTGDVYATNLYDVVKLTSQLIRGQFGFGFSAATLHDDPDNERLILQNGLNLWYLHYDEAHFVDGTLAVTGPMIRPSGIKAMNVITTDAESRRPVTIDDYGRPYYEGFGFADGTAPLSMLVQTREIYPSGLGEELESESFFVHSKPAIGEGTITITVASSTEANTVEKAKTFAAGAGSALVSMPHVSMLERYQIKLEVSSSSSPIAINYIGLEVDEERGKLS